MENENCPPPALEKSAGGYTVYYKNTYLYDRYNPVSKIIKKIEKIEIKENTLIVVPSPLLYYGVDYLSRKIHHSCRILCIERDPLLFNLKDSIHSVFKECDLNKIISIQSDQCGFFLDFFENRNFPHLFTSAFRHILFLPLNSSYLLHREFYLGCSDNLKTGLNHYLKNSLTLYSLGERFFRNLFLNIPSLIDYTDIKNISITKPVVAAGSGESLESAIPLLKKYRDSITIFAIDTSLRTLLNSEIVPDYVVVVESQFFNIYDFYGLDISGIPLIADMSAYPLTFRLFKGKKYLFTSLFKPSRFIDSLLDKNLLPSPIPPLGSVALSAIYIALKYSDYPVFYTGIDFSFKYGKTHSKDSTPVYKSLIDFSKITGDLNFTLSSSRFTFPVKNQRGEEVYATNVLLSYSKILEKMISRHKRIYSLFSCGMTGNKFDIPDENTFKTVLEPLKRHSQKNLPKPSASDTSSPCSAYLSIMRNEIENIVNMIDCGTKALNNIDYEANASLLYEKIKLSDYLIPNYPGFSVLREPDPVSIKHILLTCYKFKMTLEKAEKIILHQS